MDTLTTVPGEGYLRSMSTVVCVDAGFVSVSLTGVDAVLALRRQLRIPLANIASAQVMTTADAKRTLGLRIGGGYLPGAFATGNFLSRNGLKGRQFWSVYRDHEVLVLDLIEGKLRRVVLQTPDRVALAASINAGR